MTLFHRYGAVGLCAWFALGTTTGGLLELSYEILVNKDLKLSRGPGDESLVLIVVLYAVVGALLTIPFGAWYQWRERRYHTQLRVSALPALVGGILFLPCTVMAISIFSPMTDEHEVWKLRAAMLFGFLGPPVVVAESCVRLAVRRLA